MSGIIKDRFNKDGSIKEFKNDAKEFNDSRRKSNEELIDNMIEEYKDT